MYTCIFTMYTIHGKIQWNCSKSWIYNAMEYWDAGGPMKKKDAETKVCCLKCSKSPGTFANSVCSQRSSFPLIWKKVSFLHGCKKIKDIRLQLQISTPRRGASLWRPRGLRKTCFRMMLSPSLTARSWSLDHKFGIQTRVLSCGYMYR